MTHRRGAVAVAVICALSGAAGADELRSTVGQPLREVSHQVDITVARGIATYRVRRVFANPGDVADEAGLRIDLPYGAAATGLRIRARHRWYEGELMEREKAAKLYQELTGKGAFAPKDPALLQWLWANELYLQVFPVLPGQASTVEYTLTVPTRYVNGKLFLSYPRLPTPDRNDDGSGDDVADGGANRPLVAPVITVTPAWGDATTRIVVDGLRVPPGAPIVLPQAVKPAWADAVDMDPSSAYVASTLVVPATGASKKTFTTAKVKLGIAHTWRGDVQVDLLTPRGERVVVRPREGGEGNDIKETVSVKLPAGTPGAGTWLLVVSDNYPLDVGTVDEWSLELGSGTGVVKAAPTDLPLFIPDPPESGNDAGLAMIELEPPRIDVLAARLGKVVASDKHSFARLELDVAPELRPLPAKAKVVFVVDGSHSIAQEGIDAQLAMVSAYLAHVPDAVAEIVVYRRKATRLFGALVPAKDVARRIAEARKAGKLAPGNGSALDEGGRLAAAILKGEKAGKDGLRVVITTDELVRSSLDRTQALAALAALPRDVILHVVVPGMDADPHDDGATSLTRDDAAALAPLAAAHRGMMARVGGLPAKTQKDLVRTVLGLVRPMQLDYVKIAGLDVEELNGEGADVVREGAGLRSMQDLPRAPETVTVTAKIWGDAFKRTVAVDAGFSLATAGWVFSEDMYGELSDAEQLKVAMMGRAVSPVTSYLAIEPGVRPMTIGIDRTSGGFGFGRSGVGYGGGGAGSGRIKPDLMSLVARGAEACVAKHKPAAGWKVRLDTETTRDEVVDVTPIVGDTLAITPCLVEAVWAVRLGGSFDAEREMHTLVFE